MRRLKNLLLSLVSLGLLFILGACANQSEAGEYLDNAILNKHSGDGAEQIVFKDESVTLRYDAGITPDIDDPEEYKGKKDGNEIHENVSFVDGENGEYIVKDGDEVILTLTLNDDGLLKSADGNVYLKENQKD